MVQALQSCAACAAHSSAMQSRGLGRWVQQGTASYAQQGTIPAAPEAQRLAVDGGRQLRAHHDLRVNTVSDRCCSCTDI